MSFAPAKYTTQPALRDLQVRFAPAPEGFIADEIFVPMDVDTRQGRFLESLNGFFAASSDNDYVMGMNQEQPTVLGMETILRDGWFLNPLAARVQSDYTYAEFARGEGVDQVASLVDHLDNGLRIIRERKAASIAFDAATVFASYTTAVAAADRFDASTSNPYEYILEAKQTVVDQCGVEPNCITLGRDVYRHLLNNGDIRDRMNYAGRSMQGPTRDVLASLFEVKRISVARAIANTAQEGATESLSPIFTANSMLLHYEAEREEAMRPKSTLMRFRLRGSQDGALRMYDSPGQFVQNIARMWVEDFSAIHPRTGHLYTSATA